MIPKCGGETPPGAFFLILSNHFSYQPDHFTRFGVTVGLELGINQTVIYLDLELATVRRDQGQVPDIILELLKQFVCQAHGPVGVMSNRAVDDFDVDHVVILSKLFRPSTSLLALLVVPLRDGVQIC
jgi:hypothetical protein